ncbi:hypothetical protein RRG08_036224 [Elysia crispata]|uniref:Uncharacterized protein n=1 Tax=Elysia crispata TaxID=231223 RepID=A0AAE0XE89_9GAST|nr:hypothetical protein RRG08_036224 [Elysia crispata]
MEMATGLTVDSVVWSVACSEPSVSRIQPHYLATRNIHHDRRKSRAPVMATQYGARSWIILLFLDSIRSCLARVSGKRTPSWLMADG